MKQEVYCQSCGMPMASEDLFGTNADQSKSEDYCCYCYKDGAFLQQCTMEEMVDFCLDMQQDSGMYSNREEAKAQMMEWFITLRRWAGEQ